MKKFSLNGRGYKIVNGRVCEVSKNLLTPCFRGDYGVLDDYCRLHKIFLPTRGVINTAIQSQHGVDFFQQLGDMFRPDLKEY